MMNILVENLGNDVVVALTGSADSLQYDSQSSAAVFRRLGEQAARPGPDRIWIDFQGLAYIDGAVFHQIAEQIYRLKKKQPQVDLVGPGPALERLFSLVDPPKWWTWSRLREISSAAKNPKAETPRRRSTDPKRPPVDGGRAGAEDVARGGAVSLDEPAPGADLDFPVDLLTGDESLPVSHEFRAEDGSSQVSAQVAAQVAHQRVEGEGGRTEEDLPDDLEEPAAETDVFEIDLDRELLLLESEPPCEEFNPMADPVDLSGAWKAHAGQGPAPAPGGPRAQPADPVSDELHPDFSAGDVDPDPPLVGEDAGVEDLLLFDAEDPAPRYPRGPVAEGYSPKGYGPEGYAIGDLEFLEETAGEESFAPPSASPAERSDRNAAPRGARALHAALAVRIREIDTERLILHRLLAEMSAHPPAPAEPFKPSDSRARPQAASPGRPPTARPQTARPQTARPQTARLAPRAIDPPPILPSGHAPGRRLATSRGAADAIPAYLRGDVARSRIIRSIASVLEDRRRGRPLSPALLRQIASALASAAQRAPFASFDLRQACERLPLEARLVHTTGMALCVAAHGGARPIRLGTLALTSLVWGLVAGHREALDELSGGDAAAAGLARNLHLKVLQVLGPGHEIPEDQVRQDLRLLTLAREFWRRLGDGVAGGPGCAAPGGSEPAVAMAALARGEIGRQAPARLRRLFVETFSAFPPGSWVRLHSGEVAVVVAPGTVDSAGPLVLCLFSGGETVLRLRPPRLVDTGRDRNSRVEAAIRAPSPSCARPRDVLRVSEGLSTK